MKTRSLTEGAMLSAITVLLTIIGEYIGLPALIVPVPLTLLVYRHGIRLGIIMSVASALTASLVAGHVLSGVTIIIWGFLGIALGMALREKFSFAKTMIVGIGANLVITALNVFFYSLLFGKNMFEELLEMMLMSVEQAMSVGQSLGLTEEMLVQYERMLEMYPLFFRWGLPALLLLSAVVMTYINLAVTRLVLKRMGDQIPWIAPFSEWRVPSYCSFGLILGVLLSSAQGLVPQFVYIIGFNLMLLFFPMYLVIGLSIVWHFFNSKQVGKFVRILFVIFLFTFSPLSLIVTMLGVLDAGFDFRKLRTDRE